MSKTRRALDNVWPHAAGHIEVVETVVTRDQPFCDRDGAWGTRSTPPPGEGWRVVDYGNEKRTRWERPRLVPA
jgi:hypothetical protein